MSKEQAARSAKERIIEYLISYIRFYNHAIFKIIFGIKNELRMSHVAKLAIYCLYPFHEIIYSQKLEGD